MGANSRAIAFWLSCRENRGARVPYHLQLMNAPFRFLTFLLLGVCPLLKAADLAFLEEFAVPEKRAAALQQLVPGTDDYYYYHCLNHQHQGQLAQVDALLRTWFERCGETERLKQIRNRQALLNFDQKPAETADYLRRTLGLSFEHSPDALAEESQAPNALDANLIAFDTLRARALAEHEDVSGFGDGALASLATEQLSSTRLRSLLNRLTRPDFPNLVRLIADELALRDSRGFGSIPIHRLLLLAQLDELVNLRPTLRNEASFIHTYLTRLQPPATVDVNLNVQEREAYLDRLWTVVSTLEPVHSSLKAHVLYHRLKHDRQLGVHDKARFMAYLALPRRVDYLPEGFLSRPEYRGKVADLGAAFEGVSLLPPVGRDESLVRSYLLHFFSTETDYRPYLPFLREDYVKSVFAEAKILTGQGDMEQWASLLGDPAAFARIKDRVEVEFAPTNRVAFTPGEILRLGMDLKNVKSLVVRVFELNTINYYRDKLQPITDDLDLDGLVATEEKTYTFDQPPTRRWRQGFEWPARGKRGVWVVDFIGNGHKSRAVLHLGDLRATERLTSAGHEFTVMDEANRRLTNATLWMAGREYTPDPDGTVTLPYSTKPGPQTLVLQHDGFGSLHAFEHQAEKYQLHAAIHVERETLLNRRQARLLVRPSLLLNNRPVDLSVLEGPVLVVEATDQEAVKTTKEYRDLKLSAAAELVAEFQVPENLASLTATLRGRVQSLTEGRPLELTASRTFPLNQIDRTQQAAAFHLSRTPQGYIARLLGKNGEPRAHVPVNLRLDPEHFHVQVETTLQTDNDGRVALGALTDVAAVHASTSMGPAGSWNLPKDRQVYPGVLQGRAGEELAIPYPVAADAVAGSPFSLLERRAGGFLKDWGQQAALREGFLVIRDLPAGEYSLLLRAGNEEINLRLAQGEARGALLVSSNQVVEVNTHALVQIDGISNVGDEIVVRVRNASEQTRVHVAATRFLPEYDPFEGLVGPTAPEPLHEFWRYVLCGYGPGSAIGEEYRYILERKGLTKMAGNMLPRPGLLLNPRRVQETKTTAAEAPPASVAMREGAIQSFSKLPPQDVGNALKSMAMAGPEDVLPNLNFFAEPSVLLANLRPDKDGVARIPRGQLGPGHHLHVVVVDDLSTAYQQSLLPENPLVTKDLRLATSLEPQAHFVQKNRISLLQTGQTLRLAKGTDARLQVYDSLRRVHQLFGTLNQDTNLTEFSFILDWPKLPPARKRELYSRYASHELSFFVFKKDPAFFESVVLAYLRNKKDKTFLDHWLLRDDLGAFTQPWAFGRLNAAEQALLAQRLTAQQPAIVQHLQDLLSLKRPTPEAVQHWFFAALRQSEMEAGSAAVEALGLVTNVAFDAAVLAPAQPLPEERVLYEESLALADQPRKQVEVKAKARAIAPSFSGRLSLGKDVAKRGVIRQLFRQIDKTQEWAENNYHQRALQQQNADLVPANAFWADYAQRGATTPFLSEHLAQATSSFAEMMLALAVLDLPFEPATNQTVWEEGQLRLTAASPLIVFHSEIAPAVPATNPPPVMLSQNYFNPRERTREVDGEFEEVLVTGEFHTGVVYGCQAVVSTPSAAARRLDLLLQIPQGALPVGEGRMTRSLPVTLQPFQTAKFEYFFYFPAAGEFTHFPAHAGRDGAQVASAQPTTLRVTATPPPVDTNSWENIAQRGAPEAVLNYLRQNNPLKLDLDRMAWRLKDKAFFEAAVGALAQRRVYHDTTWSYAVHHRQANALREFLLHRDDFIKQCGPSLESPLLRIDPVQRKSYEHLEYSPLVNARAHPYGGTRRIENERQASQYRAFLEIASCRPKLDATDYLSLTYQLLLQDRVAEARDFLKRVEVERIPSRLQYDYLRAYLDFYTPDRKVARELATQYREYPVDRWRQLFAELGRQLDQVAGTPAAAGTGRDQAQEALVTSEPACDFTVESRQVTVRYENLSQAEVRYYFTDLELLFSRNPFNTDASSQFALVTPNRLDRVTLPARTNQFTFPLPENCRNANLLVEIQAGGLRRSRTYLPNSLNLQLMENYGQLRLAHASTSAAIPGAYVKVYARKKGGEVTFYKDGYTDPRGRFDYVSLNTDQLDAVERFAILVMTDNLGATIREATPPKR